MQSSNNKCALCSSDTIACIRVSFACALARFPCAPVAAHAFHAHVPRVCNEQSFVMRAWTRRPCMNRMYLRQLSTRICPDSIIW
eukprot:6212168-Pleurochrysis_carterae.AAC.6